MVAEFPLDLKIYAGMRITLTKNLKKSIGFVNGMGAKIIAVEGNLVYVITDQLETFPVHLWTSNTGVTYYPFRLGYATTLHKIQGATLKHITLWLDTAGMEGAGYVALSRVEYDRNWQFIGAVTPSHFRHAKG